ncbi:fucose 4-O-acetylase-like acetyltransferase [Microcella putealis]|uniref:Fucose 4-O-acetylase-like acetyltransferase n=2 Tax=Microcella putealis TaxID=337005 RepID=A0A4V2EWW6_9MICO|nr:fucose 4-O-acetylase-like acetyltransferase [Microcella putealis]TQM19437.1 fucose 4-O-acetylase-like acetyltransferase [Microcella putealis]
MLTLTPFRMPLLFVIAGVLAVSHNRKKPVELLGSVARKIYWPYLVWTAILLNTAGFSYFLTHYATDFTAWIAPGYLWFIFYLGIFILVSRLLSGIPSWSIAVVLLVGLIAFESFEYRAVFVYGICFFAGAAISQCVLSAETIMQRSGARAIVLASGAVLLLSTLIASSLTLGGFAFRPWGIALTFSTNAAILISLSIYYRYSSAASAAVEYLGRNSLVFYLSHWPIMVAVMTLATTLNVEPHYHAALLFGISLAAGCIIATLRRHPPVAWFFTFPWRNPRMRDLRKN